MTTPAPAAEPAGGRAVHVFLAPHYDDVALSCGGTVAALAAGGHRPLIATVFGGTPAPTDLTAFARWQHKRWRTGARDTIAVRLAEDHAAAAVLGNDSRVLPFLDAIYRGEHYLSDAALFGPVADDDAPLVRRIAGTIAALPALRDPSAATVYVPLGGGNHVDHQIVFEVGRILAARGCRVLAYEDFPYAVQGEATTRRLAVVAGMVGPPLLVPIAATLERRIAAITAYGTQLPTIFRFTDDWPASVAEHARGLGGAGGPVERFWPLKGPV